MNKIIVVLTASLGFSTIYSQEASTCSRTIETIQNEFSEAQTDSNSTDSKALFAAQGKLIQLNGSLSCLKAEGTTDADLEKKINDFAEEIQKKISGDTVATAPALTPEEDAKKYAQEKIAMHKQEADGYREEIKQQEAADRIDNEKKLAAAKLKQDSVTQPNQQKEVQAQQPATVTSTAVTKSDSPTSPDKWENEKRLTQDISDRAVNLGKGTAEAARYVLQDGVKDAVQLGASKYKEFKDSPSNSTSAGETARNVYGFIKETVTGGQAASDLVNNSKQVGSDISSGVVNLPKKAITDIYDGAKTLADGGCEGIDCAKAAGKYIGGVGSVYGIGKAATTAGASVIRAPAASVIKEATKQGTQEALTQRALQGK